MFQSHMDFQYKWDWEFIEYRYVKRIIFKSKITNLVSLFKYAEWIKSLNK